MEVNGALSRYFQDFATRNPVYVTGIPPFQALVRTLFRHIGPLVSKCRLLKIVGLIHLTIMVGAESTDPTSVLSLLGLKTGSVFRKSFRDTFCRNVECPDFDVPDVPVDMENKADVGRLLEGGTRANNALEQIAGSYRFVETLSHIQRSQRTHTPVTPPKPAPTQPLSLIPGSEGALKGNMAHTCNMCRLLMGRRLPIISLSLILRASGGANSPDTAPPRTSPCEAALQKLPSPHIAPNPLYSDLKFPEIMAASSNAGKLLGSTSRAQKKLDNIQLSQEPPTDPQSPTASVNEVKT
ncbi:hypothetical protein IFR05_004536 [Cadophora sp. M221]|nr:hypothetical protein IFR05_004536 [Cadophora sp. M221]